MHASACKEVVDTMKKEIDTHTPERKKERKTQK